MKVAAPWGTADRRDGLVKMQHCIEQCRLEMGADMELIVDCYLSWDFEFTTRLAKRVQGIASRPSHFDRLLEPLDDALPFAQ